MPDGPFLKHPQQFCLQVQLHVPDLIKEQRSSLRQLEQPLLGRRRIGKGPFFMAEQLALQQGVRAAKRS